MPPDQFSLDDLRLVRAVAESRSLAAAAVRLGIDPSTVFRRLGALEERLGVKLFERHRAGYRTNSAGEDISALASRMDDEMVALSLRLAGQAPESEGEVRVTTNDTLLIHLLTPIFAAFRRSHPQTRLDILLSNEALNLSRRDADVAIRVTAEPPETLVGRRIASLGWALYAPSGTVPETASPGAQSFGELDWVALGGALEGVAVARATRRRARPDRIVYKVDTVLALADAVEAGLGIGYLPCYVADRRTGLARIAPPDPELAGPLWLLTHPELRQIPRIRSLLDHLARAIAKERTSLAGLP